MASKTLKLVFPQWQGLSPSYLSVVKKLYSYDDLPLGYVWGAKILKVIAPNIDEKTVIDVPISTSRDEKELETIDGIYARAPILQQLKNCMKIINEQQPTKIITLGGECSISTGPFSYLAGKYRDDVALVWFDAHYDISLPYEPDLGFDAMPVTHIMGVGDQEFLDQLPAKLDPKKIMFVGVREFPDFQRARVVEYGIKDLDLKEYRKNPNGIKEWLHSTGCKKVMVHLDLDVIDPSDFPASLARVPEGMLFKEVSDSIASICEVSEMVGFTVAEHVPYLEMKLRQLLKPIPIFD